VREFQVEPDVPVLRIGYLGAASQILGQERPARVLGVEDAVADLFPELIVDGLYRVTCRSGQV
jgi:hypothetical protein